MQEGRERWWEEGGEEMEDWKIFFGISIRKNCFFHDNATKMLQQRINERSRSIKELGKVRRKKSRKQEDKMKKGTKEEGRKEGRKAGRIKRKGKKGLKKKR